MSDRKNTLSPRQWFLLGAATLALVTLCVVVGLALVGQGRETALADASAANASNVAYQPSTEKTCVSDGDKAAGGGGEDLAEKDQGDSGADNGGKGDSGEKGSDGTGGDSDAGGSSAESGPGSDGGNSAPSGSTPSDSEPTPAPAPTRATIAVAVTIDARLGGGGLSNYSSTVNEGASVYDALCATGVAVGGSSTYVRSINGLAEFQAGRNSGWFYYVNGVKPNIPCGSYTLTGGESVTWLYVDDYTKY